MLDDAETTYKHYTTLHYTRQLQYESILFIAFIVFWYSTLYKVGGMREHTLVHTFNTQYHQSVPRLRSWCMELVGFRFTFGCWRARGTEYAKWDCERRGISRFGFFGVVFVLVCSVVAYGRCASREPIIRWFGLGLILMAIMLAETSSSSSSSSFSSSSSDDSSSSSAIHSR